MKISQLRGVGYLSSFFTLNLGVAMLLPAIVDLIDGDDDWRAFFVSSVVTVAISLLAIVSFRSKQLDFSVRVGFLLTTCVWVSCCAAASLPFLLSAEDISTTDSIFEAISGFTTTGATVLSGLDDLPRGLLVWRSMLQWFGGIGIVAMGLLLFPFLRIGGLQLFRTESSDRSDKVLPRMVEGVSALMAIYVALTFLCFILYRVGGMSSFDAINHAMTTISTAGFSTHDDSMAFYADHTFIHWVAIVFMIAGALPFALYIRALTRYRSFRIEDAQVPVFLATVAVVAIMLSIMLHNVHRMDFADALTHATFNTVSIITTTGYASHDYGSWGAFAVVIFFTITFIGGCSGSTTGGFKIYRYLVLAGLLRRQLFRLTYPHAVSPASYSGKAVADEAILSVASFTIAFIGTFVVGAAVLAACGLDFLTAVSGAASAITNVGPGLGDTIGPTGTYGPLPDAAKWTICFMMLMGRLEIMTVIVLLTPEFWRE